MYVKSAIGAIGNCLDYGKTDGGKIFHSNRAIGAIGYDNNAKRWVNIQCRLTPLGGLVLCFPNSHAKRLGLRIAFSKHLC